ncbi:MAG: response regulator transcription factor [Candidatus Methylomirabilia bacterium]
MGPISVLIAGGAQELALCRRLLHPERGIAVVGVARTGLDALAPVARLRPRVLLLDFDRPRLDALAAIPRIRIQSPRTKVVLLTTRRTPRALILEALSRGARGYLDRGAIRIFLPKVVRAVDAGEVWVPRRMVAAILNRLLRLSAGKRRARGVPTSEIRPRPESRQGCLP